MNRYEWVACFLGGGVIGIGAASWHFLHVPRNYKEHR